MFWWKTPVALNSGSKFAFEFRLFSQLAFSRFLEILLWAKQLRFHFFILANYFAMQFLMGERNQCGWVNVIWGEQDKFKVIITFLHYIDWQVTGKVIPNFNLFPFRLWKYGRRIFLKQCSNISLLNYPLMLWI